MKEGNENNVPGRNPGDFGLPDGYFRESARSIVDKIEWHDEHKDFSVLLNVRRSDVFAVPSDYFLQNESVLELTVYPVLNSIRDKTVFAVPENYFEGAEEFELARVLKGDNDERSGFEMLDAIKRESGFTVPPAYFSRNETVLTDSLTRKQGRIVSLFPIKLRYAVAALLVIALGLWIYNLYFVLDPAKDCGTIACLEKQDLVKSKSLESFDDEELYELVDPAALEKKLQDNVGEGHKETNEDSSKNEIPEEDLLDEI